MQAFWQRLVHGSMRRQLRRAFRRVVWVGEVPELPPDVPVVLYANHHGFFDAHLVWIAVERLYGRPVMTWMAEWDRFPFFGAVGAQPFPPSDPARRAATLRRTARHFREAQPPPILVYFPEGHLHAPEQGILPFDGLPLARLGCLLPSALWWPVAVHVTWRGEALPTALLAGGEPRPDVRGDERERLEALWHGLRTSMPGHTRMLLEGAPSPEERWNFAFTRRLFARYL